ncbi:hypothetical protein L1887_10417 [Cichorium endivia]|nr:hypothetical protein L1887_10417 [Cichorium endivia]
MSSKNQHSNSNIDVETCDDSMPFMVVLENINFAMALASGVGGGGGSTDSNEDGRVLIQLKEFVTDDRLRLRRCTIVTEGLLRSSGVSKLSQKG